MMSMAPAPKRMRDSQGDALAVLPAAASTADASMGGGRSSSLPSPTLKLTGHTGSVYALQYSPSGATLCSTSFDMTCLLWSHSNGDDNVLFDDAEGDNTAEASYRNFNVLQGHKNAVLDCAWCDEETVATASADKTVMLWDTVTGNRLRKWAEHTGIVNAVCRHGETGVVSASDDTSCAIWDRRQKRPAAWLLSDYPILACASSETHIFTSGIDPKIHAWDPRRTEHPVYSMSGHTDTVTSLAMHPESTHVLSNAMDQTLKSWDIRPFCTGNKRLDRTFIGHRTHGEKGLLKCSWSADNGSMVSCGSADFRVHIWDYLSAQELYDLPGHAGCVNAVTFHPVEKTVVASASSDQQIYVGELS